MQVKVFNYSSRNPETVRRFAETAALHIVCAFESKFHLNAGSPAVPSSKLLQVDGS